MRDERLQLQEEVAVLRDVAGLLDVLPGEAADGLLGLPEGGEEEVDPAALDAAEDLDSEVAGSGLVVGHSRAQKELVVGVPLVGGDGSVPLARNHGASLSVLPSSAVM